MFITTYSMLHFAMLLLLSLTYSPSHTTHHAPTLSQRRSLEDACQAHSLLLVLWPTHSTQCVARSHTGTPSSPGLWCSSFFPIRLCLPVRHLRCRLP